MEEEAKKIHMLAGRVGTMESQLAPMSTQHSWISTLDADLKHLVTRLNSLESFVHAGGADTTGSSTRSPSRRDPLAEKARKFGLKTFGGTAGGVRRVEGQALPVPVRAGFHLVRTHEVG